MKRHTLRQEMVIPKRNMAETDVQVKVCQQEIVKLDLQIKAIIQDIRDCEGPIEALHELNQNVREVVVELKNRIEELERLAHEQDKETDKVALLKDADNQRTQLARTQSTLRQANLNCHLAIERREKEYLLGTTSENKVRQRGKSDKAQLAATSSGITENLMSISRMMASQVQRSEDTISTLVTSSKQLSDTNEEFKSMSGHIQNAKKLITKYGRREITDKLLIFLALVFFFATVLYIVKKRLF